MSNDILPRDAAHVGARHQAREAAAHARGNVHMVQAAPRQYEIHEYCGARRAWIAGRPMNYHAARAALVEARHAAALIWLGWDRMDAHGEAGRYDARGRLADRIRRSLERA